jgi:hypothetical protein
VLQAPSPGLPETLCWVLARLKQADCVADMAAILSTLARDVPALHAHAQNVPALVHAALGSLIKARRVYYTGKGYFLVAPAPPDAAGIPRLRPPPLRLRGLQPAVKRDNACQTEPAMAAAGFHHNLYQMGGTPPASSAGWSVTPPSWASSPAPPATPSQQHRLLSHLSSLSPPIHHNHLPLQNGSPLIQRQSPRSPNGGGVSPFRGSPQQHLTSLKHSGAADLNNSSSSSASSPDSSLLQQQQQQATLERSQSLRVSKKSMRKMAKGGSLRISKKDTLVALLAAGENETRVPDTAVAEENTPSPPKKLERKNSFLGRIFGRKKSASSSSSSSGGSGGSPKKEILTFSGQFPPPELAVMPAANGGRLGAFPDLHSVETQTPPHQRRKPGAGESPAVHAMRPQLPQPQQQQQQQHAAVPTAQVKSGPNGNYIVYEREFNGPGNSSNNVGRPLPQSPPLSLDFGGQESPYGESGGHPHHHHIYSQPNSTYGGVSSAAKPPPPAYSLAPPYRPKESQQSPQRPPTLISSPAPQRPSLVTTPKQANGGLASSSSSSSPQKQVHFAASPRSALRQDDDDIDDEDDGSVMLSPAPVLRRSGYPSNGSRVNNGSHSDNSSGGSSSGQSSSLSGPSSLDSVLYDDSLVVIEKSNQELELRLSSSSASSGGGGGGGGGGRQSSHHATSAVTAAFNGYNNSGNNTSPAYRTQLSRNRIDTIHNNRHLDQEVIYEDSHSLASSSRSSSQSTLKPSEHHSLTDLGSILDLSAKFQSLTARKLIAGLSISSIDTLLEVNAAAAASDSKNNNNNNNNKSNNSDANGSCSSTSNSRRNYLLDESTETIDFGVI